MNRRFPERLFAAFVLLFLLRASAAHAVDLPALLEEAGRLFHEAANIDDVDKARPLYQEALDRYLMAVAEGRIGNGKLYYDIGNAYFALEDVGRAILYYRKAERLIPADGNLRHNLRFARSQRADMLPSDDTSDAVRILLFWHYLIPPAEKVLLFAAAFGAACVFAALFLLRRARWKLVPACATGVFALLLLGSLASGEIRLRTVRDGVVVAEEAVVRKGDGTAYQRSFIDPVHSGAEFRLLDERAEWLFIELPDGRAGWIPSSTAQMVDGG